MKKHHIFWAIIACFAVAISVASCKKENKVEKEEEIQNSYTFDGTTYEIKSAGINRDEYGGVLLVFSPLVVTDNFQAQPDICVFFYMNESDFGKTISVASHIYYFDQSHNISLINTYTGTVKVVKNGESYTVDMNVTFDDNGTERPLTGHYSGPLEAFELQ